MIAGPVRLKPWGADDLELLRACNGDPVMMRYLGGPESPERIVERQQRYQKPGSRQYKIIDPASGEGAGWVGYWEIDENVEAEPGFEIGWAVIPAFQGRGLAAAGTREALRLARLEPGRFLHAYPRRDNGPSNGVCRKAGFVLLGAVQWEYPKGTPIECNDWRVDLLAGAGADAGGAPAPG